MYASFSDDIKSKYEWIHQPETGGAHFGMQELYWRLKTPEDHAAILAGQEEYVNSIPDGKTFECCDQMFNRMYYELPLSLKKQFVVILRRRYLEEIRITVRADEFEISHLDKYDRSSWVKVCTQKSKC